MSDTNVKSSSYIKIQKRMSKRKESILARGSVIESRRAVSDFITREC